MCVCVCERERVCVTEGEGDVSYKSAESWGKETVKKLSCSLEHLGFAHPGMCLRMQSGDFL